MSKLLRLSSLLAAALLGGCAAPSQYGVHGDYVLDSAPGEGLIAFSTRWAFGCRGPAIIAPVNPVLIFEGTGPRGAALLDNPLVARHYEDPPGYFYTLPTKAGDYKVTRSEEHTSELQSLTNL